MDVLLDTDVSIELMRGNPTPLSRIAALDGRVFVSAITVAELYFGAYNSAHPAENAERVRRFLAEIPSFPLACEIAERFGSLKADLKRNSTQLGPLDLLIAATALENGCAIATGNIKHFLKVPGLQVLDWIRG